MSIWDSFTHGLSAEEIAIKERRIQRRKEKRIQAVEIMCKKLNKSERIRVVAYFNNCSRVMAQEWLERNE